PKPLTARLRPDCLEVVVGGEPFDLRVLGVRFSAVTGKLRQVGQGIVETGFVLGAPGRGCLGRVGSGDGSLEARRVLRDHAWEPIRGWGVGAALPDVDRIEARTGNVALAEGRPRLDHLG